MERDVKQVMRGFISVVFNNAALVVMALKLEDFITEPSRGAFLLFLFTAYIWLLSVLIIIGLFLKSRNGNCKKERKDEVDLTLRATTADTDVSGKTEVCDIQSLAHEVENVGYRLKVFDIAELGDSWNRIGPFIGTYDISGEDRQSFIEQLSKISEFTIVEEDNLHTRIRCEEKKGYTEEQLDKMYSEFIALMNSFPVVQIKTVVVRES